MNERAAIEALPGAQLLALQLDVVQRVEQLPIERRRERSPAQDVVLHIVFIQDQPRGEGSLARQLEAIASHERELEETFSQT